jgi:signal transduction histidine kinase
MFATVTLIAAVVIILAASIWNGANVLSRAWDDVRSVRKSEKLLVLLVGEASRLQNLIHRYINQPSQEVLTEILLLHGNVLSTLRNRGAVDPVLSGSADELRAVTERFLQGFGEVRALQTTIAHTYENEVLKPAREMAGLYAIIEGAIGARDSLMLPSLGKSREAFTASLVAANAFYLSLASDAADEARKNITTVEQTVSVMIDLAENNLQRNALRALAQRAAAFGDGLKTLAEQFAMRTNLLKTAIDDNQAAMIAAINKLSGRMTLRESQVQGSFDRTLADIYQDVTLVAFVLLALIGALWLLQRTVAKRTRALTNANVQLAAQSARLRQANAFKSEMLGTVAHDLKNPLGVILGRTEILKEITTPLDENVHAQIDRIRDSANRLTGMLDDLVASAMADALDITIKPEAVDVTLLVQGVVEGNRPIAARKGQTITFTGRINRPVICDPERIHEAIDNLVSNAVKYSPIGGAINVSVGQEADSIAIEVHDTGPGFSAEDMSRLFGRFQRLSARPTAGESSTGLGLSIVKRILDLHGGRIIIQTDGLPTGATVRMTLPAKPSDANVTFGRSSAVMTVKEAG